MRRWGRGAWLSLAALAVAAGGCSSDGPEERAKVDIVSPRETNPCDLADLEDAARATGTTLVEERVQLLQDGDSWCQWVDDEPFGPGSGWLELRLDEPSEPSPRRAGDGQPIEVGDSAATLTEFDADSGEIVAGDDERTLFLMWTVRGTDDRAALHRRLAEFANAAWTRAVDRRGVTRKPAATTAPLDPCTVVPGESQIRILGGQGGAVAREYVGGRDGGQWQCELLLKDVILGVRLSRRPVSEPDLTARGEQVPGLGRPAVYSPPRRHPDGRLAGSARLSFRAGDGRRVDLDLAAGSRDDRWHRESVLALGREAMKTAG